MKRFKVSILFIAILSAFAIVLTGCGGGGNGDLVDRCPGQTVCGGGCMPTNASCCPDGKRYCNSPYTCNSSNQCVMSVSGTCDNGGGNIVTCALYNMTCGETRNGIQVVGWIVPVCCTCPAGTYKYPGGRDNITPGGPYETCQCNGY